MIDWQPLYPAAVYLLLGVVIVALLLFARHIAVSAKSRNWLLFVLRGFVLAGLAILLLNPIDHRETRLPPRPPSVALLVDCSQSMGLGVEQSRIERVKQTIGSVTERVRKKRAINFPLFRFGNHLAKVPGVSELTANEDASLLSEALQRLPSRIADQQTRAVVLFSDGAVGKTEQLDQLAAAYRKLEIPVHAMLPDQQELLGDIAITKLSVPPRVVRGDKATIRAKIESRGFEKERVIISIRSADRPRSSPLASLPITLGSGTTSCELVITADPDLGDLALEIPVQPGEAVETNNRIRFQLAQRERKLRVLYMEGSSAREVRFLQDALHADSDIQCVSMTVNNQYAQRQTLQRLDDAYRGFPVTREELFAFDVVICSDISFAAFTPEQIEWTVELVDRRGGGFVMVGGHTSFGAGGWDRTPWEGLIPFDMAGRRDYLSQTFRIDVPEQAQPHPIWHLLDDPQRNREALAAMPPFFGTNLISRVKPAATLLGQTQQPLSRVGVMPVFACESYGRGRTFAMATDTTYHWGQRFEREWGEGDNRYFQKFWRNVVRWLAENSQASQQRLILRADQVIYSQQDNIELVAETFDKDFKPTTDYRLTAQLIAGATDSDGIAVTMDAKPSLDQYTATIPAILPAADDDPSSPMQSAKLVVTAWDGDDLVATNSIALQLLHRSDEWLRPQSNPETLQRVAEAGGGQILSSADELERILESYDTAPGEALVHQLPMWDHWIIWTILLIGLTLDWTLRRQGKNT